MEGDRESTGATVAEGSFQVVWFGDRPLRELPLMAKDPVKRRVASGPGWICFFGLVLWLLTVREAQSAAPTLTNLFPAGGQRGTKVTVTCAGSFAWPVKVWAPGLDVVPSAESGKLDITIPADLRTDRVWIRLYNEEGASAVQPFLIGGIKEVNEVEPNDKPRAAQAIMETAVTVNGTLKSAEVDCFAVSLTAGQTLVAAVDANTRLGSPMDAILQIVTPDGVVLAENHDDLKLDPRLAFAVKSDGTYVVRLFAFPSAPDTSIRFSGSAGHIYRLTLTTGPFVTHAVPLSVPVTDPGVVSVAGWNLPNDLKWNVTPLGGVTEFQEFEVIDDLRRSPDARIGLGHAADLSISTRVRLQPSGVISRLAEKAADGSPLALVVPSSVTGCLKARKQSDDYVIPLTKGQHIVVSVESRSLDLPLDPVLKLVDPGGAVIADVDDTGSTKDALIASTAARDGDFRLTVSDRFRQGSDRSWYLLTVRYDEPDFELSVTNDAIVVGHDKPAELAVKIVRRGKGAEPAGPISIQLVGLPEGFTSPAVVSEPTGPTATEVKLSVSSSGTAFSGPVRILGKTTQPKPIERNARTPARLGVSFDTIWVTATKAP